MKKLIIVAISLAIVFQLKAQQSAKTYIIKSGKVVYNLTGSTTGTKTIYFDDYGNKHYEHEKSVTETKVFGITDRSETDKITIINNNHFWTIDNINKKYYEGALPYSKFAKETADGMTEAEKKKLSDDILASFGGQRLGTEKVLGYSCEKISVMGSLIWVYKGISLKSKTDVMGIIVNENAVSFDENINVPSDKFNPPSGIRFADIDAQQQALYGDMSLADEEEEDDDNIPVTYPFEDFKKVINTFNPAGYSRMMVTNQDGQHIALYSQGMTNVISVMATAEENMVFEGDMNKFETFTHKGKTMRYGNLDDEGDMDGKALIIPYSEHDMYIIIMSAPGKDKNTLLKWADELDF